MIAAPETVGGFRPSAVLYFTVRGGAIKNAGRVKSGQQSRFLIKTGHDHVTHVLGWEEIQRNLVALQGIEPWFDG
jgi:hypothetical protein